MLNDILKTIKSFQEFENTNIMKSNQLKYYNNLNLMFTTINYLIETINSKYEEIFLEDDDQFTKVKKIEKVMRIFMLYTKLIETLEEKMSESSLVQNSENILKDFNDLNCDIENDKLKQKTSINKVDKVKSEKFQKKQKTNENIANNNIEEKENIIEKELSPKEKIRINESLKNTNNTIKSNSYDLKKQLKIRKNINLNKNRKKKNKKPNLI